MHEEYRNYFCIILFQIQLLKLKKKIVKRNKSI